MFTGLIQEKSRILGKNISDAGCLLLVSRPQAWSDLKLGESIAVNGVCLTLTEFSTDQMSFFVGNETLSKTTFESPQEVANVERALALGERVGGHLVSGHIDGLAQVKSTLSDGEALILTVHVPADLLQWVVPKGSVAVNGVSLTVKRVDRTNSTIEIMLIPETLRRTNLGSVSIGDALNFECDQIVKSVVEYLRWNSKNEQHS